MKKALPRLCATACLAVAGLAPAHAVDLLPRVGVQFEIDANGILHVLARDLKTGHQKVVEMKSAVDVSDTDVQKMIEESVEHAFDDLKARQWIEAKLRAGETLSASRKGLAEHAAELEPSYEQRVEAALAAVEAAVAAARVPA